MLDQVLMYARGIWRRRWLVIAFACVFSIAGWITVAFLPDTYSSMGRIYVDTRGVLGPLLTGVAVASDVTSEVEMMKQTLLSRPNLEKLSRLTDRDIEATTDLEREKLINKLLKSTVVKADRSNLFTITFEDTVPERARDSVQALIDIFVEQNLGANREDMDMARLFVDNQISYYERQLVEAEEKLAEFKRRNLELLPGPGGYHNRVEDARAIFRQLEADLQDTIIERGILRQQLQSIPPILSFMDADNGQPQGAAAELLALKARLAELRVRYTDEHPDVIASMRRIGELERSLNDPSARRSQVPVNGSTLAGPGIPNPTHSELSLTLAEKEAEIATLERRVVRQKEVVEDLESKALTVPIIEAELAKLTRDYGVLQEKYEDLLSRRESAKIARDRGATGKEIQFRVVEPPIVPAKPSGPNRPLLISAVFLLSFGAGGGFAFVFTMLNSTFSTLQELREEIRLPILGAVTDISAPQQKVARVFEYSLLATVGSVFVLTYAGSMLVERQVGMGNLAAAVRDSGSVKPAIDLLAQKISLPSF